MKKRIILILIILIFVFIIYISPVFAIFRNSRSGSGTITAASWSVSRNQSGSGETLNIVPEGANDSYTLTVQSNSEVDVTYTVIISSLPTGVEVSLDGGTFQSQQNDHTITFTNVGTIHYSDATKTRNHTLTFKATSNASIVSDQEIDIDVKFQQTL